MMSKAVVATVLLATGAAAYGVAPAPRARTLDFEADLGGVAGDSSLATAQANGKIFNATFVKLAAAGMENSAVVIPAGKNFFLAGGIMANGLTNFTLDIQGKLTFNDDTKAWPKANGGDKVLPSFRFTNCHGLTFTGAFKETAARAKNASFIDAMYTPPAYDWGAQAGVLDGQGAAWWGIPLIGYLINQENRPRLLEIDHATDVLVENIYFRNSGYWTFWATNSQRIEVRNSLLTAMRDDNEYMKGHGGTALTAFNTDGFDFGSSRDIWVHDVETWNQDDCVCMKSDVDNALVENVAASGLGLTIGSIGNSYARNIVFKDTAMRFTNKGVYMKFRSGGDKAKVSNITYQNIQMREVEGYPIWIGPAQQSDSVNLCAAHPCSICWPETPFTTCSDTYDGEYSDIVLKDITVFDQPGNKAPAVILGDANKKVSPLTISNVQVKVKAAAAAEAEDALAGQWWKQFAYYCKHAPNVILEGTNVPVPQCEE